MTPENSGRRAVGGGTIPARGHSYTPRSSNGMEPAKHLSRTAQTGDRKNDTGMVTLFNNES
jgi:hypothetical protein